MSNPYVNKVVINGETKIDLSSDTVASEVLGSGYTAHSQSGAAVTGTADIVKTKSSVPVTKDSSIIIVDGVYYLWRD